jgi:hypothetical protein
MENNEIVSRLTPIFRDVFNDDALVVSEGHDRGRRGGAPSLNF